MRTTFLVILTGLVANTAQGQLIAGNDQTSPLRQIWHVNVTNGAKTLLYQGGTEANAWGMAYDPLSNTLYWNNGGSLYKSPFSMAGLTPTLIGSLNVGGASANVTGMAFDSANNKLLGYRSVTAPGFYEIGVGTAAMTLVNATPASTDFGGFDYDAASGTFYALNDGTGLSGRGLYKIASMYAVPSYALLAAYPGTDTDVDGLGVGGGFAYMVNDTNAQPFYVYDLVGNAYAPNLANPFTGTNGIFSAGAWVPEPATLACVIVGGLIGLRRRK